MRAGIITLAFLLVVITAGIYTYFAPREYESRVKIEVQPDTQKTLKVFDGSVQQSPSKSPPDTVFHEGLPSDLSPASK